MFINIRIQSCFQIHVLCASTVRLCNKVLEHRPLFPCSTWLREGNIRRVHADPNHSLNKLAGCVTALFLSGRALQCAVLITACVLENARRLCRHTLRNIGGAFASCGAFRGAEVPCHALNLYVLFVRRARGFPIMGLATRGCGCWRGAWRGAWSRADLLDASWVRRLGGQTTAVFSTDHTDIALFTPSSPPRVLHLPILVVAIFPKTDSKDTVV